MRVRPSLALCLIPCLWAGAAHAASTAVARLEAGPAPPPVGAWSREADGSVSSPAHALRPHVRFEAGVTVELALPGAGALVIEPVVLGAGTAALEAGAPKGAALDETALVVAGSWAGVDERLDLHAGALEHSLLVGRAALDALAAPEGADLRAAWRLHLPDGVRAGLETGEGLVLRDAGGRFLARVPEPLVSDARQAHLAAGGHLEWKDGVLAVVVPHAWLAAPEREAPVVIDPTVTVFPAGTSRTGWVDENGTKSTGAIDSGSLAEVNFGFDVRGFAEFDTSSIPDTATILDVRLEVWLANHDNPQDPAVPLLVEIKRVDVQASASAATLHAAIPPLGAGTTYASEDLPRTGPEFCPDSYVFRSYDLGPVADAQLQLRLPSNWFTVGFVSEIVTDPLFDHVDYIGYPEVVQNGSCPTMSFPGTRIRLIVQYADDLPPVCDAGGPVLGACPPAPQTLDGSASFDPEGEPLAYSWTTDCAGTIEDGDQPLATLLLDDPCDASCTVTLTVSDGVNESSCTVPVSETDDLPPALTAVPPDDSVPCNAVPPVGMPVARDRCDPTPVAQFLGETRTDGPCPDAYMLVRRWQAVDRCGNVSSIAEQHLDVSDDVPPVLAGVPADTTASCDDVPPVATPTATDDCDPAPAVQFLGETREDGACPDTYTLVRRWQAFDRCDNPSPVAVQRIDVSDTTPPALAGVPPGMTVECDAVPPPAPVTAADACDPSPVVAFGQVREDGDCPGNYTLLRTWTATDRCGNAAQATQVLVVQDTTPPVISSSDDVVACLWPPNHRHVPVDASLLAVEATDACSGPVEWEIVGCTSSQPDDARESDADSPWNGDGHTTDDCVVASDGRSVFARAERAGTGPDAQDGRTYAILVVARDACGNATEPTPAGRILVPHDQNPHARGCLDSTKLGLRPNEPPPR